MKVFGRSSFFCFLVLALAICSGAAEAQETPAGNSARLLVTVEPHHGNAVPEINRQDVMVFEGKDRDQVTEWTPAQGDNAALELYILIDDSSSTSLGTQLQDIQQFVNSQPPSAKVGIAYMQNGIARIAQELTADHAQAAKAVRLPMAEAGVNASPYFSLSDLVKHWPAGNARHEVLMVTDGIDRYYGSGDLQDPYLDAAIDDADRAGVVVSAIYSPGVGHFSHSYWQSYWGQMYLSELAEKTGGEAYYIGFTGAPVSFDPYLQDLANRLQHQYWLGFTPKAEKKASWHTVRLRTEVPSVDLVSAGRVYVP